LKKFIVHKEFACYYSPVFKAAFNSDFYEGQTQTYRIFDTPESAVCLLVHWLYTQKVDLAQIDGSQNNILASDLLICLWILADKLLIGSLQNAVIHELERLSMELNGVNVATLKYVYHNTTPDSKLRQLLLHQCASRFDASAFTESASEFPNEMLIELAVLYSKTIRSTELKNLMPKTDMSAFEVPTDELEGQSNVCLFFIPSCWRLTVL
jgi:hypothetical protein